MFPVLIQLGPVTLYTYGFLAALGFALAILWSRHAAPRFGLSPRYIQDLCFYLIVSAIIGARLWFVALAWPHYREHPLDILKFWEGGLVFYGGLFAALLVALAYMTLRKKPILDTGDTLAPGLALGQAVGRLGCLAAGCCHGAPSNLPWAITFTDERCLAPLGTPLHPTQAYASLFLLALFGLLVLLQRRRIFPGQVFWTYGLLHGLFRPWLETWRGDFRGPEVLFGLTSTQIASLALALFSAFMLVFLYARRRDAISNLAK
ncbi:MAG: prolipoprotein diacylglyceryl transferase [Thermodesulfobacteriota bacterium]